MKSAYQLKKAIDCGGNMTQEVIGSFGPNHKIIVDFDKVGAKRVIRFKHTGVLVVIVHTNNLYQSRFN